MGLFKIQWRRSTKKDFRGMPRDDVGHILAAVTQLAQEPFPHGSHKLSGAERTYRIRVGDYRVIYEVLSDSHTVGGSAREAPKRCLPAIIQD